MNNKKGFTLVELLAVIAILAILVIIAIPNILKSVEDARKSTAEQSTIGYVRSIESDGIVSTMLGGSLKNGAYKVNQLNVKVDGNGPTYGNVTIEDGKVVDSLICINNYKVAYYDNKAVAQSKCNGDFAYGEGLLNGAEPVLKEGLIPVTIDSDGTVKYADINTKWYSYRNKEWANAIILSSENSKEYSVGQIIPESAIESYFVWIPRYKYKLWNVSNTNIDQKKEYTNYLDVPNDVREIEIVFENNETTPSNGNTNGSWLTHPAFTSFDSNGMWVGKFETGYKDATNTTAAQDNSIKSDEIIIKPNVYSWRGISVGNIFSTAYNYKRGLDSHMMKNTEWGAIAYLIYSKYGMNGDIRINNNKSYITGYSALNAPTCGWTNTNENCNDYQQTSIGEDGINTFRYNSSTGYLASATGNITGIYDMSGGANEYVAGYLENKLGSSEFNPEDYDSKYYDVYKGGDRSDRILGDSTGEFGPYYTLSQTGSNGKKTHYVTGWNTSFTQFVKKESPWFVRGGYRGSGVMTGPAAFLAYPGEALDFLGFRIVLTPQK